MLEHQTLQYLGYYGHKHGNSLESHNFTLVITQAQC